MDREQALDREIQARGIVLRVAPVKESDLMLTLLLENHGRVSALAKGARNSRKRFLGGIDLFDCALFELELGSSAKGSGQLYFANGLSERRAWLGFRQDLVRFSLASLALELTEKFAQEGDPHTGELYSMLLSILDKLNCAEGDATVPFIRYVLVLIIHAGTNPLEDESGFARAERENLALVIEGGAGERARALERLLAFTESHYGFSLKSKTPLLFQLLHREQQGSER